MVVARVSPHPTLHLEISMEVNQLSWQRDLPASLQINPQYPIPTCLSSNHNKVYDTNSAPSFSSCDSPETKQDIWNFQVPRTKRIHYTKGPQCAGLLFFFHNSHSSMTHTMSQSHHTIVWKGKQHIKQLSIFLSMIITYLEQLRGFSNVRGVLRKSQRQRRESRAMSHRTKSPGFQKQKEKS